MEARYATRLEWAFSADRLARYRPPGGDDRDMIATYLWNVALCAALAPLLHNVEGALRNSLHAAATALFDDEFWFDRPFVQDKPVQRRRIAAARLAYREQRQRRLPAGAPIPPPSSAQLVARLPFGFWTGIMHRPFTIPLWPPVPSAAQPGILRAAFPYAPVSYRSRAPLFHRFDRLRLLHHRAFRYEPVWDWRLPAVGWQAPVVDLNRQHAEVVEALRWIEPLAADAVLLLDQFPAVWGRGRGYYRRGLGSLLNGADRRERQLTLRGRLRVWLTGLRGG